MSREIVQVQLSNSIKKHFKCKWMTTAILKLYKSLVLSNYNPTLYDILKTNFNTHLTILKITSEYVSKNIFLSFLTNLEITFLQNGMLSINHQTKQ